MLRFRDLSIRRKFIIAFLLDGFLIAAVALSIVYLANLAGLNKIEDRILKEDLLNIQNSIHCEQDILFSIAKDYANWDDMYNYVSTEDAEWAKANITQWIPKNFSIDLIMVINSSGKLIYEFGNFPEFKLGDNLLQHPLISNAHISKELKGLYFTSKGLVLVVSSQIMHTDESGPRNGTYLYAKFINEALLLHLKTHFTGIDLSLISQGGIRSSTATNLKSFKSGIHFYNDLSAEKLRLPFIYKPDLNNAFVYGVLKDISGKNVGVIESIRSRDTVYLFTKIFYRICIMVLIFVILAVYSTVLIITTKILKPLKLLRDTIEEIKKTKNTMTRLKIVSGDEIGRLTVDFNGMMDVLNKSQEELMQARGDLIKAERMGAAAELALGAVHQINNPLSIVISRAELLRRALSYKAQISEVDLANDLQVIETQSRRAVEITNSLLRYAKPSQVRFEKCNINELLQETIASVKAQLEEVKISVITKLNPILPNAEYCDIRQMRDVFLNIINNAQQSMPGGGKLEISSDYDVQEKLILIKLSDNGIGIPKENVTKIFTPFFSTKAEKSGLGLAISYNILKAHHGTIEVESEIGVGSTFTLKFPARKTDAIIESFS